MIGVVGPDGAAERLAGAIEGRSASAGTAESVLADGATLVAAVGEAAVTALAGAGADVPVLPVGLDDVSGSVALDRAAAVLERVGAGAPTTREWPVVGAELDGEARGRGAFEVALVTDEPARISAFAVETPGGTDRFRADGVAVSTPAGSAGYTRTLGGPVLDLDAESLAVVPIAAFAVRPSVRVTRAGASLTLRVTRDEGDIRLLVDGEDHGLVGPGRPLAVDVVDALPVVVPPTRLEKL